MKKLWLAFLFTLCFAVPAFAGSLTIAVHDKASVKGPYITLGEIAAITGEETGRIEQLADLRLGYAPAPGSSTVLTRELLGTRLAATGVDFSDVVWQTSQSITIMTESQVVSGQRLADAATQAVYGKLSGITGELTVTPASVPSDVLVPLGTVQVVAEIPAGVRFTGFTTAYITIFVDGQRYNSIPVRLTVKLYQQVVVAARAISGREVLTADSIRLERFDTGRLAAGYITDSNQALGLQSRRLITQGTVITGQLLEKPVLIARGSTVTVVARMGDIEVTVSGQALQDGVKDQLIRVQNTNSRRIITAKVVDDATVLVGTYSGK